MAATAASTSARSVTSQAYHGASPQRPATCLEQLGLEAGDRDARASLVEPVGQGGADPARRAGDQHPSAGERGRSAKNHWSGILAVCEQPCSHK